MRYDLVDLRLFLLIAEAGSITQGAERAGLALASASARIKGMEEGLGTPLLLRQRRGITLTPAGQTLLRHARAVSNQVEAMIGALGAHATGLRAHARLLSNTAGMGEVLEDVLPAFLIAHPQVDIDLEELPSPAILEALASGAADLGIASVGADVGSLEQRPFRVDRLVLIAPPRWEGLPGVRSAGLEEVAGERFVGLGVGAPLQELVTRRAARLGYRLDFRIRVPTLESVCHLVAGGVGLGIVPEGAALWPGAEAASAAAARRLGAAPVEPVRAVF